MSSREKAAASGPELEALGLLAGRSHEGAMRDGEGDLLIRETENGVGQVASRYGACQESVLRGSPCLTPHPSTATAGVQHRR